MIYTINDVYFHFFVFFFQHFLVALTKLTPSSIAAATTSSPSIHPFPAELEELQSILHFPEEVALRITDAEYQLFYQVNNKYEPTAQMEWKRNKKKKIRVNIPK